MGNQTNLNVRTDMNVKINAEQIFEQLGLNMTTAVNMFLRQVIIQGGIPFEIKLDIPNETTVSAIKEGRELLKDKNAVGYKNIDDLRSALDV